MKHIASARAFAILAAGMAVHPAIAAPFCITNQVISPQCIYYDAEQCNREAVRQNATCSANAAELKVTTGNGQFCVVTSAQIALCNYADWQTCNLDANRQHGTCTIAPTAGPLRTADPYSTDNGK